MDDSFTRTIESAKSVLVLLPTNPRLDEVAAGLALYLSLSANKEVNISCPTEMIVRFNQLIGVDKISKAEGNKNLVIAFNDYLGADVERVSFDVENGKASIVVFPKANKLAPKKEQVNIGYSGISSDLIILVGGASEAHFPILSSKEARGSKLAHIGTRALSMTTNEIISLAIPGSSVSEVVAETLTANQYKLDADIATNLLTGIENGSRRFTSEETTPATFEMFASLMRAGGVRSRKMKKQNLPPGAIPGQIPLQKKQMAQGSEGPEEPAPPGNWYAPPKVFKGASTS